MSCAYAAVRKPLVSGFAARRAPSHVSLRGVVTLLAQLASDVGRTSENAQLVVTALEEHPTVDLVVFPELFLTGYAVEGLGELACRLNDTAIKGICAAAARLDTAVVVGFAERVDEGVSNSAICIDRDGRPAGVYRKTHLFGAERAAFHAGNELLVVPLVGRRVSPLICFDVEFPETARRVALAGADLLVTISANRTPYYDDHELASRARALDNRLPHIYVNAVGSAGPFEFVGGSRSIASDGTVLAELPHSNEELLVAVVAEVDRSDTAVDYLGQLRGPLPVATP